LRILCEFIVRIELQKTVGLKPLNSVSKLRPILIIWIVVLCFLLIPINIWAAISTEPSGKIVANVLILVASLTLMVLASYYGWTLIQTLKNIPNIETKKFLKKVI
jgi:hypothetical protein